MVTTEDRKILDDVVIIRLLLIVLLVLYHAFAPFCGAWEPLTGQKSNIVYWWIGKTSFSFLLEMFVFISGYVCGYQVSVKGKSFINLSTTILGKLKRLVLPSIIFSIFYILCFSNIHKPPMTIAYNCFNGYAHMWFLPMLYWCFIGIYVIEKLGLSKCLVLTVLVLSAMFPISSLPLRLDRTMYYMLFFYTGYQIQKESLNIDRIANPRNIAISFLGYIAVFVIGMLNEVNHILDADKLTGGG